MRRIDDMLKFISPDELNGGADMDNTEIRGIILENNKAAKITERKKAATVKSRLSGVIAAALVLVLGGGALTYSLLHSKPETSAGVSDSPAFTADAEAKNIYRLINANLSARIADGRINDVKTGEHTADLSSPDEHTAALFALDYDGDEGTVRMFEDNTRGIGAIPKSGEIFYHIDSRSYRIDFLQYRDTDGYMGQYPNEGVDRKAFGIMPENLNAAKTNSSANVDSAPRAHAFYDIVNRMKTEYFKAENQAHRDWALLPPRDLIVLDLDKRDRYADLIWRMEQYNSENVKFTGKVFIGYDLGNDPNYVAWQPAEGGVMEVWSKKSGAGGFNAGDVPDSTAAWYLNQATVYAIDPDSTVPATIKCSIISGGVESVIASREDMPQVFEWYEKFLSGNYEPVSFDPGKLISADKLGKIVSFDWVDMEKKEDIIIRTSDMEGADIYVNGRYYNVEDTSVLNLPDKGLPEPIGKSGR